MITEYQLTNFKAFGDTQTLPIRPLTLIFGPNSSGKSSIFQSVLMLKQTIEQGESSQTRLLFKGNLVDLGSYKEFIHRHDTRKSFSVRVTFPLLKDFESLFGIPFYFGLDFHNDFNNLKECISEFRSLGIGINFLFDQESFDTVVSKIELFLGDDKDPILTYAYAEGYAKLEGINNQHKFWFNDKVTKYIESFSNTWVKEVIKTTYDKWFDELLYQVASAETLVDAFNRLDKLLEERKSGEASLETINRLNELKKIFEPINRLNELLQEATSGETPLEPIKSYQELLKEGMSAETIIDTIKRLAEVLKKGPAGETSLEAINRLKELLQEALAEKKNPFYSNDQLSIDKYLPVALNDMSVEEIIPEYLATEEDAGSLSLVTLAAAELFRRFLIKVQYIGPLRENPERYFTFSGTRGEYVGKSGKFTPDLLITDTNILGMVNKWFDHFDIGYELNVSTLSDSKTDYEVFSLRLVDKSTGLYVGITDVGFGLSQVLPVIVQGLISKEKTILIEQPEYHLHPRLQAELGDMFIESALGEQKNTFLIETHSEHLILRILRRIRETAEGTLPEGIPPIKPEDVSVVYVQPGETGSRIIHLPVDEDGEFTQPWPEGFFPDRAKELM
ncbi:MAG: DUF3696 domain-containing protein [Desulfobacteraceae bacterium]